MSWPEAFWLSVFFISMVIIIQITLPTPEVGREKRPTYTGRFDYIAYESASKRSGGECILTMWSLLARYQRKIKNPGWSPGFFMVSANAG